MSLRAALTRRYNPDNNPWDPELRDYRRLGLPQRRIPQPNMHGTPTMDGAPVHPVLGGGRKQRVPLPVFKQRPPRRS